MFPLTFLYAADGTPLTKSFSRPQKSQPIQKSSYPMVKRFTSSTENIATLDQFYKALQRHAKRSACLLKGQLDAPLDNESRAGHTDPSSPTQWLCLDFDAVGDVKSATEALALVGISGVNHIVQYSASMGITNPNFNAHIFILLSAPISPETIKAWAKHLNLTHPVLSAQMTLTRSSNALRWPLDISVNQNDKLIYIAPPTVYDGVRDPLAGKRIELVKDKTWSGALSPDFFTTPDLAALDAMQLKKLNELRKVIALPPKRTTAPKNYKGVAVGASPTVVQHYELKEDRGFAYLNLNGGDSWAYYFPLLNPEILYNFKGEDNYALKDILPQVYAEYAKKAEQLKLEVADRKLKDQKTGAAHLAFLDPTTDVYYRGTYDFERDEHDLLPTSSLVKLQHYMKQHGQPVGDFVPEWRYEFDFASDTVFDPDSRFINRYQRTAYLRSPQAETAWPTIERLIRHVTGDHEESYYRFLNWLAYILQRRQPARTAWLFHGVQGTGKGLLFNSILAPIVGQAFVHTKRLDEIEESFNAYMQECVFLLVDEIQISDAKGRNAVMAKLKNAIPNPTLSIRAMRSNHVTVPNWVNFIFASNKPDPIDIDPTDRRFNVAPYQKEKLQISQKEVEELIPAELAGFTHHLMALKVNVVDATTAMDSDAKRHIKYLTRNSIDLFADALRDGDIDYFFSALPSDSQTAVQNIDLVETTRRMQYEQLVASFFDAVKDSGKALTARVVVSRDDLRFMAEYLIGKMPDTPNRFTALVKHHGIDLKKVKQDGKTIQGVITHMKASQELVNEWYTHWVAPKPLKRVK